jgi:soluble lytic murein transglycosylase-like protein
MLGVRRLSVSLALPLRAPACLIVAGGWLVTGCMPTEHVSRAERAPEPHAKAARASENAQPATFAERLAPLPAAPVSFADRIGALSVDDVPASFGPTLAYAPAPSGSIVGRASAVFPFALRGTETAEDFSGARVARIDKPVMPRPAPQRGEESTRGIDPTAPTRVASLDPSFGIPATAPQAAKAQGIPALVTAMARKHGVPVPLAHAVVRVESNYKPGLIGRGATYGLMQIKYPTARGLGFEGKPKDLFDPATNLEWGMRYLAGARKLAKGNLCGTVLRYQGGHYSVRMTRAASVYCSKVRRYMAEAGVKPAMVEANAAQ